MGINRCIISGNLTRDPEQRVTQGGTSILTFGVAVNERRKNPQTGEWEDYPNYIDCVLFGNRAEALGKILAKGMKVAIEGKLRWSQWERDGQKRSKIEVIVEDIEFMSRQGDQKAQNQQQRGNYQQQQYAQNNGYQGNQGGFQQQGDYYSEDCPF